MCVAFLKLCYETLLLGGQSYCIFSNFIKTLLTILSALKLLELLRNYVTCLFQELLEFILSEVFVLAKLLNL